MKTRSAYNPKPYTAPVFQSVLDEQSGTTVAYTVASGTDRFLVVSVMRRGGSTISITYNGVSMTQIGSGLASVWNAGDTLYQFGLVAPATGSNNIVITHNGTLVRWSADCYNGVNQSTPTSNPTSHQSASAAPQTISVTPSQNSWIVASGWINSAGSITPDSNSTYRTNTSTNGRSSIFDSNSLQVSTYALGYTDNYSGDLLAFALILDTGITGATSPTKAYYPLNGNSTDYSGNGNNGTDTAITYPQGKFGQAAKWGATSGIESNTVITGTGDITISCWVNIPSLSSFQALVFIGAEVSGQSIGLANDNTANKIRATVFGASNASTDIPINQWCLVTGVWTAGNTSYLYINGQLKVTSTGLSYNISGGKTEIGRNIPLTSGLPSGSLIDEVIIESRAWTPAEVSTYYRKSMLNYRQRSFGAIIAMVLTALKGTFTLTGKNTTYNTTLKANKGSFSLLGKIVNFILTGTSWSNQTKNTSTWTNATKNTSTFTNQSKNSSSWTNQSKS